MNRTGEGRRRNQQGRGSPLRRRGRDLHVVDVPAGEIADVVGDEAEHELHALADSFGRDGNGDLLPIGGDAVDVGV